MKERNIIWGMLFILVAGLLFGYIIKSSMVKEMNMQDTLRAFQSQSLEDQRTEWIAEADFIRADLAKKGKYDCCLENPCWYCIYKDPKHGPGAECSCRDDIMNGVHPCGECIGEILEGHGLPELAPYYAKAIAHKVGAEHEEHLQEIIDDMYQ